MFTGPKTMVTNQVFSPSAGLEFVNRATNHEWKIHEWKAGLKTEILTTRTRRRNSNKNKNRNSDENKNKKRSSDTRNEHKWTRKKQNKKAKKKTNRSVRLREMLTLFSFTLS